MGKYLLLLFCIFYAHCVMAQEELDTHQVGDVIYSVFPPDKFNILHGGTWMLLAGQDSNTLSKTDLYEFFKGVKNPEGNVGLPDARGVFIRGMTDGRFNDPDIREVGSYQKDALESHNHQIYKKYYGTVIQRFSSNPGKNVNNTVGWEALNPNEGLTTNSIIQKDITSTSETRPENISLYIYIKVNN